MAEYLDRIFHPNLVPIIKWLMNVGALLVILWGFFWNFSGPIIEVYAEEILEQKLIKMGVNPKMVAEIQAQQQRNSINILGLGEEAEMIRRELSQVKRQAQAISGKQDALSAQTTRIEGQVDRIVNALISRGPQ
ncbi:MAG: hypothetical protein Q8L53_16675 [Aestuariivirga sp.]|nr:hypothetical protein [Aestuariivirga sp.]